MINLNLNKIEKSLGFKLRRNAFVLGFDTASTTGIAKIITTNTKLMIETSIIKIPSIPQDTEDKAVKYEECLGILLLMMRDFKNSIKKKDKHSILVLENSYLGFNAFTYGFLKACLGIVYANLYDYFEDVKIIFPLSARKMVGFKSELPKGTKAKIKKQEIMDFINNKMGLELKDDNEADATMLALAGLKE